MRTTLTIDDDNAAILDRLRKERDESFKELVNEALRKGLVEMSRPSKKPREPFRTPTADLGKCLLPNVDNIGEVLEMLDGPMHK